MRRHGNERGTPNSKPRQRTSSGNWVVLVGDLTESDSLDLEYWLEHTTSDQRVQAVHACLVDSLATKGRRVPRFRRIHRFVERSSGAV